MNNYLIEIPKLLINKEYQHSITGYWANALTGEIENEYPLIIDLIYDTTRQELKFIFTLNNNPFVAENNYYADNSLMWNQEVFEIFIAPGDGVPNKYLELELNPNNALFSAFITNADGRGNNNQLKYIKGRELGIKTSCNQGVGQWQGSISLPLLILGNLSRNYRINFYRVVSFCSHDKTSNWIRSLDSCKFLAWSPTFSGTTPDFFHLPKYFGKLVLPA